MADNKEKFDLSIDEKLEVQEESLGTRLQPGIHENVLLIGIKYVVPDKTGAKWEEGADFIYKTTGVSYARDNQGNVDRDQAGAAKVISKAGEEAIKREFFDPKSKQKRDNLLKRIKHVMTKFLPAEEAVVKGSSFQELIENVIAKLDGKTEGVKLRLKVVKNNNGYGEIPGYTPFVERMDTSPSNLKITDKEKEGAKAASLIDLSTDADSEIVLPV